MKTFASIAVAVLLLTACGGEEVQDLTPTVEEPTPVVTTPRQNTRALNAVDCEPFAFKSVTSVEPIGCHRVNYTLHQVFDHWVAAGVLTEAQLVELFSTADLVVVETHFNEDGSAPPYSTHIQPGRVEIGDGNDMMTAFIMYYEMVRGVVVTDEQKQALYTDLGVCSFYHESPGIPGCQEIVEPPPPEEPTGT